MYQLYVMDSPLLSYVVLALAILFSFLALLVESQANNNPVSPPSHSPPPPPPPHHHHHHHLAPPTHPNKRSHHYNSTQTTKDHRWHRNGEKHKKARHDSGKKVGFWFIGLAAALQVCVVGFLIFERRRLFKDQDILS